MRKEAESVWLAAPTNPGPSWGGQSCFLVKEAFQGRVIQELEGEECFRQLEENVKALEVRGKQGRLQQAVTLQGSAGWGWSRAEASYEK